MAVGYNPRTVTDGLVLALDAGNPKNYNVGISTNWTDKVGGNNGTLVNGTYHNDGPFVGAGYVEFDGNNDYLSIADSADFTFGTGDYTMEAWIYPTSTGSYPVIIAQYENTSTTASWFFSLGDNTTDVKYYAYGPDGNLTPHLSGGTASLNTWTHVAVTRSGSTVRLFVNGSQVDSGAWSNAHRDSSLPVTIGTSADANYDFTGKISNARVIKGTALYTSNFTPPTRTLTAVPNTVLLTCQGNSISDASSSAHTITANGDISLTKEPFGGAGAVDFGGSADGLYTPNITLGSNDWTLEFWIYLTSTGTARGLYSYFLTTTTARQISYSIDSSNQFGWQHRLNDGTYPSAAGSTALSAHTWYHVAAVRVNDDYYTYINGVQDSSYTSAPAGHTYYADGRPHYIGYNRTGTADFDGLLSNVRFVNGTALYTSNFTPPAEPLTAVTNTELLTCQGQSIKDASSNAHTITVNGDAKATIVSSAFEFDGTDDELNFTNIDVGTGDFTYEAWVYPTASVNQPIIVWHNSTSKIHTFGIWASGQGVDAIFSANARPGSSNSFEVTSAISLNTWHHIAFVRASGTLKVYVDGTEKSLSAGPGSIGGDPSSYSTDVSYVGTSAVNENFKGEISAVKIYKGKALTAQEIQQNYNATKGRYA